MRHTQGVPELADVEHFRRFFSSHAIGRRISGVWVDPTILRNTVAEALGQSLVGYRFLEPERLGKWLICPTDGPVLLLHFGMTGDLIWSEEEPERHRHDRLILEFSDGGELRYRNMRKLGGVWLAHDDDEVATLLQPLGPDALAIDRRRFMELLRKRRGGVKAALMDQSFVAGVGNILADEILWHARLHPKQQIGDLTDADRRKLCATMRRVLREAVEGYDYIPQKRSWLSHVRGLPGAACPRCRTRLERTVAAGRTTYYCPACQPAPGAPV